MKIKPRREFDSNDSVKLNKRRRARPIGSSLASLTENTLVTGQNACNVFEKIWHRTRINVRIICVNITIIKYIPTLPWSWFINEGITPTVKKCRLQNVHD